ncbi:aldehyde dehydrogenase family protein [Actinoplanes sp. CA-030573]|uniref:aldehyde dehydrogenase family protein n=1 Tax=Actinoplanes sp. CA-030573 TaxID=3239898 RepID=UPI003D921C07
MIRRENPARVAEIVGSVAETSPNEVDAVVWAADAEFRRWRATALDERLALLTRAAEAIEDALADLSVLLARETGQVLGDCRAEIGHAVRHLRWVVATAPAAFADEEIHDGWGNIVRQRRPYGVIAAIVPGNAPVLLAMIKIAPALAAGNAVVLKPSPLAPLTLDRIVRLIGGPLRIVHGGAETGAALAGHELVRRVAFTGGASGGRAVAAVAGGRLVPAEWLGGDESRGWLGGDGAAGWLGGDGAAGWLGGTHAAGWLGGDEAAGWLGGSDSAVFLDDAPFDDPAMDRLVRATFATGGQVRMAARRLFVPATRLKDFVEAYEAAAARVLVTGDPLADGVTMGPVISAAAQKAAELMRGDDCRDLGRFDADPETGYFVRPCLVVEPDPRDPVVSAERFAPVVPVLGYRDEEAVPAAATNGDAGPVVTVWSADRERAMSFARRFEAGVVFVNCHGQTGVRHTRCLTAYVRNCVIHTPPG